MGDPRHAGPACGRTRCWGRHLTRWCRPHHQVQVHEVGRPGGGLVLADRGLPRRRRCDGRTLRGQGLTRRGDAGIATAPSPTPQLPTAPNTGRVQAPSAATAAAAPPQPFPLPRRPCPTKGCAGAARPPPARHTHHDGNEALRVGRVKKRPEATRPGCHLACGHRTPGGAPSTPPCLHGSTCPGAPVRRHNTLTRGREQQHSRQGDANRRQDAAPNQLDQLLQSDACPHPGPHLPDLRARPGAAGGCRGTQSLGAAVRRPLRRGHPSMGSAGQRCCGPGGVRPSSHLEPQPHGVERQKLV